jgi:HK97 family phage major capsid protein
VVTEGTLKPQSELTFDDVTQAVVTIAHWVKASKQILADAPQLQSFIDGRLRYGLAYKEEQQLLHGTGTGGQIEGLVTAATAYAAPIALSGATMIDKIRLALLQAALAEFPSDGVVVNPIDWARVELTKDGEGRYIIGNPRARRSRRSGACRSWRRRP